MKLLREKTKFLSFVIIFLMCTVVIFKYGYAEDETASYANYEEIEAYVEEQINVFAQEDPYSLWNGSTVITNYIELYSPYDDIIGYIFWLSTGGQATGFIQVEIADEIQVINLGYEGEGYLTDMIDSFNSKVLAESAETDDAIDVIPDKVYYLGGFNYYVYNNSGKLIDLSSGEFAEMEIGDLIDEYDLYVEYINEISATENDDAVAAASSTYLVSGYSDASSYLVTMEYFSGKSNHCSPTAATNMVLYWKYARGYFSSDTTSASTIFNRFYILMGTTSSSGTSWSKILPAYVSYISSYSGVSVYTYGKDSTVTMSEIKTKLDDSIPIHLEIKDFASEGENHSVNVWGYAVNSSSDYFLRITNNWGDYAYLTLINYSSYDYGQFVFFDLE